MTSHDRYWIIERYPEYDDFANLIGVSYGCPQLDLMGYSKIVELLDAMKEKIFNQEVRDLT